MEAFGPRLWIILALSLGPAVSNSFARFAYALVLPAMRADLGWNYSQAGWLNSANAIGYLAGAMFTVRYVSRAGNRRLFSVGMLVTAAALIGTGLTSEFVPMLGLRIIAGLAGAMVFICGGVLASNVYPDRPRLAPAAIALYFGGAGVGILLSGVGVPWLLEAGGNHSWPDAWLAIGVVSALFAVLSILAASKVEEPSSGARRSPWRHDAFYASLASYFLFGAGYIAYMTFVVAWMKAHGAPALEVSVTWVALGLATIFAPILWRVPIGRWRGGKTLAAASTLVSIGAAVPLFSTAFPAMVVSALLFGGGMFTAPAAVTTLVKKSLPKAAWGAAVAAFTVVFALGQSIGPILTGWLADATSSLYAGLAGSALILLLAGAVALCQREIGDQPLRPATASGEPKGSQ